MVEERNFEKDKIIFNALRVFRNRIDSNDCKFDSTSVKTISRSLYREIPSETFTEGKTFLDWVFNNEDVLLRPFSLVISDPVRYSLYKVYLLTVGEILFERMLDFYGIDSVVSSMAYPEISNFLFYPTESLSEELLGQYDLTPGRNPYGIPQYRKIFDTIYVGACAENNKLFFLGKNSFCLEKRYYVIKESDIHITSVEGTIPQFTHFSPKRVISLIVDDTTQEKFLDLMFNNIRQSQTSEYNIIH